MRHVLHFFKTKDRGLRLTKGNSYIDQRLMFSCQLQLISKTNERRNMWPVGGKGLVVKVAYPLRKKNP